jgi:xanthine dehydrogenase accessory factor
LGSARNQATRKARLAEHFDMTPEELARLHGPVGLKIGAKTPAEIAVSIMAQVIEVKNAVPAGMRACALDTSPIGVDKN